MASFPSLPLWTDAYLADTRHLTTQENGAYLLLLITAWRSPDCDLPNDDKLLAKYSGLGPRQWQRVKCQVLAMWDLHDDKYTQKRLLKERSFVVKQRDQRAAAANARWLKDKESGDAAAQVSHRSRNAPTPTPSIDIVTDVTISPICDDDLFDEWYEKWPRKVGRGGAKKAFKSALKKTDFETLCEARDRFVIVANGQDKNFIPYASTWLNQERWTDNEQDINPIQTANSRSVAYINGAGGRQPESIVTAVSDAVARRNSQF